jgi:hypothetical protein
MRGGATSRGRVAAVAQLAPHGRVDPHLVDDLVQECLLDLLEDNGRRLRCRASSDAAPESELEALLRKIVLRFAWKRLRRRRRAQDRDDEVARATPVPDRTGPTEEQVRAAMRRLETMVVPEDREKLWLVCTRLGSAVGSTDPPGPHLGASALRRLRRWREELLTKYQRYLTA